MCAKACKHWSNTKVYSDGECSRPVLAMGFDACWHACFAMWPTHNPLLMQTLGLQAFAIGVYICITPIFVCLGILVCEKLHAVLFLEPVCTISPPGTIYKTNRFVQTTIWMSQRYKQSNFAKETILAPIICTHPLILVMRVDAKSGKKE
jgi:hypothetical protein